MDTESRSEDTFEWVAGHSGIVIGLAILITAVLAVPFLTMEPETTASQEPTGPVFDARDSVEDRFVSSVFDIPVIVEARDGNVLTREVLIELRDNAAVLRNDPDQIGRASCRERV